MQLYLDLSGGVSGDMTLGALAHLGLDVSPLQALMKRVGVDCAISWKSAIGDQRIVYDLTPDTFRIGSQARTNAPYKEYLYARTIGKLFAETRNLGYTTGNILIHGRRSYYNEPHLIYGDRSLEAVWHRSTLDLLAAVALMDGARFAGTIVSYRAGHTQDVQMCSKLVLHRHLVPVPHA